MSGRKNYNSTQVDTSNSGTLAGPISLVAAFTTVPTIISPVDNCSYQVNVTTTDSVGVFSVQVSDDYRRGGGGSPGNWVTLQLSAVPIANAANDTISISLSGLPFYAMRLAYAPSTAGTGTCTVFTSNKAVGS